MASCHPYECDQTIILRQSVVVKPCRRKEIESYGGDLVRAILFSRETNVQEDQRLSVMMDHLINTLASSGGSVNAKTYPKLAFL